MKSALRIFACVFLCICGYAAWAQQPPQVVTPKAPYDSTEAQLSVKMEAKLNDKAITEQKAFQEQMKALQGLWQDEETSINAWITAVRKDNSWDETYAYDREKNVWVHTPKAEKPAPEPKK